MIRFVTPDRTGYDLPDPNVSMSGGEMITHPQVPAALAALNLSGLHFGAQTQSGSRSQASQPMVGSGPNKCGSNLIGAGGQKCAPHAGGYVGCTDATGHCGDPATCKALGCPPYTAPGSGGGSGGGSGSGSGGGSKVVYSGGGGGGGLGIPNLLKDLPAPTQAAGTASGGPSLLLIGVGVIVLVIVGWWWFHRKKHGAGVAPPHPSE